jgi:hypothetical protein
VSSGNDVLSYTHVDDVSIHIKDRALVSILEKVAGFDPVASILSLSLGRGEKREINI